MINKEIKAFIEFVKSKNGIGNKAVLIENVQKTFKLTICLLQKSGLAKARQKEKHTSYNTAYLVTAFYKSLHPYLSPLRYGKHQICRNIRRNKRECGI